MRWSQAIQRLLLSSYHGHAGAGAGAGADGRGVGVRGVGVDTDAVGDAVGVTSMPKLLARVPPVCRGVGRKSVADLSGSGLPRKRLPGTLASAPESSAIGANAAPSGSHLGCGGAPDGALDGAADEAPAAERASAWS